MQRCKSFCFRRPLIQCTLFNRALLTAFPRQGDTLVIACVPRDCNLQGQCRTAKHSPMSCALLSFAIKMQMREMQGRYWPLFCNMTVANHLQPLKNQRRCCRMFVVAVICDFFIAFGQAISVLACMLILHLHIFFRTIVPTFCAPFDLVVFK